MSETDQSPSVTESAGLPEDESGVLARSEKGPHAFRTISEVADELHVPQHVLRFWETRFEQVRPLKRGGGRRYYRPADVELLRHISDLLYAKGYTVKGVQRLLREGEAEAYASEQAPSVAAHTEETALNETVSDVSSEEVHLETVIAARPEAQTVLDQPHEIPSHPENVLEITPAPETISGDAVRWLEKQNSQLKLDLSDILIELEAFRNRLTA